MRRELQYQVDTEDRLPDALGWASDLAAKGLQAGPVVISLGRPRRTKDQNSLLWAILTDVSKQVEWYGRYLAKEDWKEIFTAALKQQRTVPGIEGGFVVIGASTSRMNKREFSDLLELIFAFGAEHGVRWSDESELVFAEHREAA